MSYERPAGLRLIIAYKLAKAVLQLAAALVLVHGATHGLADELATFAEHLRVHAVHAWSDAAVGALLRFVGRPHDLLVAAAALAIDGVVSALEGWVLVRGYRWGPWLVVIATGSLLPFEVLSLWRHLHVGRVALLAINLAVVVYLAGRARRRPDASPVERSKGCRGINRL